MGPSKLCVTVTAATTAELCRARDEAVDADLVELRLDGIRHVDVAQALAGRPTPVIATCRPTWEGGRFDGSEEERRNLLRRALDLGAEYVDLEWRAGFTDLLDSTRGRRVVLSAHDFNGVPSDLNDQVRAMRSTGAEVVKVAVTANRLSDCASLLEVRPGAGDGASVLIAMGERGIASRVLAARFGAPWTYAGSLAGVGQLTTASLLRDYRFRSITASTSLYGVVGSPIGHSVSPAMHNAAFGSAAVDAVYLPLAAADADDFVSFARAFGLKGASVTIPFKVELSGRMDELSADAMRLGAINTVCATDGRWVGANSDVQGFLAPLEARRLALGGLRAAILGAGGSARAVAMALADRGAKVQVHARDESKAQAVARLVDGGVGPWPPAQGSWDLLVNCTPIGMYPNTDTSPIPASALGGRAVYDLVYNPAVTRLLSDASAAGCETIGGLEMLVAQAGQQFEWWTGRKAASAVMRDAAIRRLSEFTADEHHLV